MSGSMMIHVKLHLVAALLLACTVSARGFAQLPPKAGEQVNLAIPSFNVTALPVYAAVDKGFFAAEGIDLRVIKVQGSHTVATLITGEIQFAIIGTTAITARLNGAPLKVIACTLARPFQWPRDRPVGSA